MGVRLYNEEVRRRMRIERFAVSMAVIAVAVMVVVAVAGIGAYALLNGSSGSLASSTQTSQTGSGASTQTTSQSPTQSTTSSSIVIQSLPSGSLADLPGNFTSMKAEATTPFGTLTDQYAVVGYPTINGTKFIEMNATVSNVPPPLSGGNSISYPFIGWLFLNGTADFIRSNDTVTHCLPPSVSFCRDGGPPFAPAADAYPGSSEWSGQFDNSTFLSHFSAVQETTTLGPTQFELTNYTLTSPVVNIPGLQWTSGCFEIGHAVGSNVDFLLAVRYYTGSELVIGFEILSATQG